MPHHLSTSINRRRGEKPVRRTLLDVMDVAAFNGCKLVASSEPNCTFFGLNPDKLKNSVHGNVAFARELELLPLLIAVRTTKRLSDLSGQRIDCSRP
jgi:hypothetical protein